MNDHALSTPDAGDDWLDAALRADGREHRAGYLDDDGFTARVIARLPLPASLPAWRNRAVFALWAVAGVGIALSLPGAYADVAREYLRVVTGHPVSLAQIAGTLVLLGLGSWTAMFWVLRHD